MKKLFWLAAVTLLVVVGITTWVVVEFRSGMSNDMFKDDPGLAKIASPVTSTMLTPFEKGGKK